MYLILTPIIAICKFFAKEIVYFYAISFGSVGWIETVDIQIVAPVVLAREVVLVVYRPMVMYSCLRVDGVSEGTYFVAISDPLRYSAEDIVPDNLVMPFALLDADRIVYHSDQVTRL